MSLDSATATKSKRSENGKERSEGSKCDGPRKDGLLLTEKEKKQRLEHKIIVSPSQKPNVLHQRWSDVQPSDLLYLTSEMILIESCPSSGPSLSWRQQQQNMQLPPYQRREPYGGNKWEKLVGNQGIEQKERGRRASSGRRRRETCGSCIEMADWIFQSQRSVR